MRNELRFYLATQVIMGPNVEKIPQEIRVRNCHKPLVITDPGVMKTGITERILGILTGR